MSKYTRRAKLAGKILSFAPFLRMAALNGSVVRGEENKKSDIDILIIAKAGRLYSCRAFATALIALTGWRRHGGKAGGRICLNCYLSDKSLNIFPENKKSAAKVASAYRYLIPLVDNGMASKFLKRNGWFGNFVVKGANHSNFLKKMIFAKYPLKPKRSLEKLLSGKIGDSLEKYLMNDQRKRIFRGFKKGDELFADETQIKLHPKKIFKKTNIC